MQNLKSAALMLFIAAAAVVALAGPGMTEESGESRGAAAPMENMTGVTPAPAPMQSGAALPDEAAPDNAAPAPMQQHSII
ncbi:MAG: hypothetical protein ABSG42_00885 [Nitrospirota bacterium]